MTSKTPIYVITGARTSVWYITCLGFVSKVCEVLINAANISYERLAELKNVGPENIQGEAYPRQERKTEQANPTVDQVRRSQTKTNISQI